MQDVLCVLCNKNLISLSNVTHKAHGNNKVFDKEQTLLMAMYSVLLLTEQFNGLAVVNLSLKSLKYILV